jgi:hypothetical protein
MQIEEQLKAIGQTAGGDGRAVLTVHVGTWDFALGDPKFEIWVNDAHGVSANFISHRSIEDVIQQAWVAVNAPSTRTETQRAVATGQHEAGYDNIGY